MIRHPWQVAFNGRLRDECLNEHWFTSLAHAQAVIETWRWEYNEERPKKGLGGPTPAAYAKTLTKETSKSPPGSTKAECYSRGVDVSHPKQGAPHIAIAHTPSSIEVGCKVRSWSLPRPVENFA